MATLNFPDAPDTGDIYFDSNSGFTYEWNGTVWISRDPSTIPNIKELDNISGSFNGSTTTFNLTASSIAVSPATAQQLLINIGNVMQNPGDDYTVSGSTITFTTAPSAGYAFQGTLLGSQIALGTVVDGTISPSSLDTSDSYTVGGITVTGITTVNDYKISGISTITKLVPSDLKVTGIGTVSNVIMTKDAAGLGATMGAAVGVVTYYGDGSSLTGMGLTMFPVSYDPGISSTSQEIDVNITLDWNRPIKAGSGTITIRTGSASGTVVDQFVVGSSSSITFANNQVVLNPAVDLSYATEYFVTFPAGTVKEVGDQLENSQVNYSFTTAVLTYQLWVWGANTYGQLGQNQAPAILASVSSPTQIPGTTWKQYTITNDNGALGLKTTGTLWSWGAGQDGQLGQNDTVYRSSPTQVGTDTTWSSVFSGAQNGIATKTDGTLWAWGRNEYAVLGQNDRTNYSSPRQVGTDTTWSQGRKKLTSSSRGSSAIKTDGTLWTWGVNSVGNLGLNNVNVSSPTQLPGTTWSEITMTNNATGATKTDGTLWVWGTNWFGSLGLNDRTQYSSPVQVPGTTWSAIFNNQHWNSGMAGLKTDGTLWTWGHNESGVLGLNQAQATVESISSPTQIGGTTWSSNTSNFGYGMAGMKTDNTLWMWGYASPGSLAQNDRTQYSSPVQVPGTDWETAQFTYALGVGVIKKSTS